MEELVKTAWEALKSNMKTRLLIAITCTIVLLSRSYIETLPAGKVLAMFFLFIYFVALIFWISIGFDISDVIWKRYKTKKEKQEYEKYVLGLSEEKLNIVRKLFNNPPQYKGYLRENDPNVLELYQSKVIVKTKNVSYTKFGEIEDINDIPILYILQPPALDIMKNNPEKFKLNK